MAAPTHVGVADFAERRTGLFNGDEVVGVGDEIGVVPLLLRRFLLLNGRRARWGRGSLAFALLRRVGVGVGWERLSSAVNDGVFSVIGEFDEVVESGVCSFGQGVSGTRVDSRTGIVCECPQ
eukprot:scaffold14196_cov104-Isochrysis_galbana.AAC.1